jgi:hypothetical protein
MSYHKSYVKTYRIESRALVDNKMTIIVRKEREVDVGC